MPIGIEHGDQVALELIPHGDTTFVLAWDTRTVRIKHDGAVVATLTIEEPGRFIVEGDPGFEEAWANGLIDEEAWAAACGSN